MRNATWCIMLAVFASGYSTLSSAHGGGLDKNGCHTNRKTGEYHCHRAAVQPPSNAQAVPRSNLTNPPPAAQVDNTCYTGPRGGRYRIVNGRKRYGC
ncbi:MAG: YHYH domain-containing protein [Rhodocyclales bacterium]|nr:YHYH domain-containing protein [Rhodocyclales bacterium]